MLNRNYLSQCRRGVLLARRGGGDTALVALWFFFLVGLWPPAMLSRTEIVRHRPISCVICRLTARHTTGKLVEWPVVAVDQAKAPW